MSSPILRLRSINKEYPGEPPTPVLHDVDLWVGPEHYRLETGDAVTHSSRIPHRNTNPGPGIARVLFCITPPSF